MSPPWAGAGRGWSRWMLRDVGDEQHAVGNVNHVVHNVSSGAPRDVAFDHPHLAMPELDRWKAAQQAHATVVGSAIVGQKRKRGS